MPINYITPGEAFGDLSVLLQIPRTANVFVDEHCRETIVFGTDFAIFGEVSNFRHVSLETKPIYYRHSVHTLRWRLDLLRSRYPDHPLSNEHWKCKLYNGPRDCEEELQALYQQSVGFARLLVQWNQQFSDISLPVAWRHLEICRVYIGRCIMKKVRPLHESHFTFYSTLNRYSIGCL